MNGILAQLISTFSFGVSNALWRKPINKLMVEEAIVYRTFFTIIYFTVLLFTIKQPELGGAAKAFGLNIWIFTILVSCMSYFGLFFFNKALKITTTGLTVIVTTTTYIFSQFTAFVLLGEKMQASFLLPFALFVIAIIISDYQSLRRFILSKGITYALLAAMFWGLTLPLLSIPAKEIGYLKTGLILELCVMFVSLFVLHFIHKRKLKFTRFKAHWLYFVLLGVFAGSGVLFNNLSYTKIPVHIAASISSSTHLVTIFAAWLLFKEKLKPLHYAAALVSMLAIFIIIHF